MLTTEAVYSVRNRGPQYSRPISQDAEESLEEMSRYKSLMTVCCAAVLTLGLAACGGGSDSDQAAAPPVEMPDPPTPMEQLTAAQDAVAAAQALVGAAITPAEIAAAYSALAAAQAQLSAAETIPANQIAILAARLEQAWDGSAGHGDAGRAAGDRW